MPTARARRGKGDSGAALVEFGLIAPVLFLILFGIIESGWAFSQYLDVRHGAREAARLAAVNYSDPDGSPAIGADQTNEIVAAACERMGGDAIGATVELTLAVADADLLGDRAFIEVNSTLDTLTGFLDFAFAGKQIDDRISFRLERDATWDPSVGPVGC